MAGVTGISDLIAKVSTRVATQLSAYTLFYDNQAGTRPNSFHIEVAIRAPTDASLEELGNPKRHRHRGRLIIKIFDLTGRGDASINAAIDVVRAAFQDRVEDQVTYRAASLLFEGKMGAFYTKQISVPFYGDEFTVS